MIHIKTYLEFGTLEASFGTDGSKAHRRENIGLQCGYRHSDNLPYQEWTMGGQSVTH